MNPSPKKNPLSDYARYSSIAMQMLVVILAGVWGGIEIDKTLNWKFPAFTVALSLISVAVAIYIAIKDFLKKK